MIKSFPEAIRNADRFHVQRYAIEALQTVRKMVQRTLSSRAKANLKAKDRLLNPPENTLSPENGKDITSHETETATFKVFWFNVTVRTYC